MIDPKIQHEIDQMAERAAKLTVYGHLLVPLKSMPGKCARFGPEDSVKVPSKAVFMDIVPDTHTKK